MYCTKCGSNVPDSNRFCPNCGAVMGSNSGAAFQGNQTNQPGMYGSGSQSYGQQQYGQQPYSQQYRDPFQSSQYGSNTSEPAPVKRSNGPAVAGFVFGILTLVFLIISAVLFGGAFNTLRYGYRSSWSTASAEGAVAGAIVLFVIACILLVFNIIFGIIGFARGLKTRSKLVLGIIGFVLMLINIALVIWEVIAFVAVLAAMM